MSAIVLDGHLKSALATVRSLGFVGIQVVAGADSSTAVALHSRFVSGKFVYISPSQDQEKFIDAVLAQAKFLYTQEGSKPVVYCFSDATALTLARARRQLDEVVLMPLPNIEAVELASDKKATYELAQKLSIPTIRTYEEDAFGEVAYPAVVKNRHSVVWKEGKAVRGSASFVFSKSELLDTKEAIANQTNEAPLVQEFITGEEYGVEMLCEKGNILMFFVHKRIRSLSPRGGAAVVKETAHESEEVGLMRAYASALAKELAWHGPVMVEFKIDAKKGQVLLMEINGRFWGSLPLAVAAGVNFPLAYYELARNEVKKQPAFSPRQIRTRHFLGDMRWLFSVFFAKDPLRPVLYPSRLRALWNFKTEIFRSEGDVFKLSDPLPSIFEYIDILNKVWK